MFYAISLKSVRRRLKPLFILLLIIALIVGGYFVALTIYPVKHLEYIDKYAQEYGVDRTLVLAIIHTESRFNQRAVSRSDARGLMQIMPSTAYWLAEQAGMEFTAEDLFDPAVNIRLGTWYISRLIRTYENQETALAAYNAGSGNVNSWLTGGEHSRDGVTLESIPFEETRNYVRRVDFAQNVYRVLTLFR